MSFASLKQSRATAINKLVEAAAAASNSYDNSSNDNFWKPEVDKAGNGYAVIRFLPAPEGESLPWAKYWDHGFKGPTGLWYIEKSLTSIGQTDPVSEMNSELWNTGIEANKEIVRKRKRRLTHVANIMVISDPANPSNEGKVFQFKFGKKIFDKVMEAMQPQFADETPLNPFDFWEGADFKIKIRNVEGYRNYDRSEFASPSPLLDGDDEKLKTVYNQLMTLEEYTDPKNYKSYEELKARLHKVLGQSEMPVTTAESVDLDKTDDAAPVGVVAAAASVAASVAAPEVATMSAAAEDDTLSYFAKLAQEG
jgi:hypothetical protein